MNTEPCPVNATADPQEKIGREENDFSPLYWQKALKGTPAAIFVPAYIRFLQGQLTLSKAVIFIRESRLAALSGVEPLKETFESLDVSPDTKQHGSSFESVFAGALFVNLISEVEHFFMTCAATVIRMYPEKVGSTTFRLSDVLAAASTEELIEQAANKALQELMYAKPADYLSGLCKMISIDEKKLQEVWPRFVEMKARRDLGVHNNWTVNEIYLRKLGEVNFLDRPVIGARLIPDFAYLTATQKICQQLVKAMATLMAKKWLRTPKSKVMTNQVGESGPSDEGKPKYTHLA